MVKSRTTRAKKRKSGPVRTIWEWFVCCGRKAGLEEFGGSEGEIKMQEKLDECTLNAINGIVSDKDIGGGDTSFLEKLAPQITALTQRKAGKRRAPPPPPLQTGHMNGFVVKDQTGNSKDYQNDVVNADPTNFPDEIQVLNYPEHLNPFGDDDDGGDEDCDHNSRDDVKEEIYKKDADRNTVEGYPDKLNPFVDDEDEQDIDVKEKVKAH